MAISGTILLEVPTICKAEISGNLLIKYGQKYGTHVPPFKDPRISTIITSEDKLLVSTCRILLWAIPKLGTKKFVHVWPIFAWLSPKHRIIELNDSIYINILYILYYICTLSPTCKSFNASISKHLPRKCDCGTIDYNVKSDLYLFRQWPRIHGVWIATGSFFLHIQLRSHDSW